MHVLIVGGGVGGLGLAQCLRKQGISFEVFERDEDKDSRFQGWAIALHTIIDDLVASFPDDVPDLKQAVNHLRPLTLPAQMGLFYPGIETRLALTDSPERPIIRAERYRLRNWLSTNIPIQWNKRVQRVEDDENGVAVYFEDGTSAKGDILVGADGINSLVREHLLKVPMNETPKVIPLAAVVGELELDGDYFRRQLQMGHSAYIWVSPKEGFFAFAGLHKVLEDGRSGKHYWMYMEPDAKVGEPDHWLLTATQQEKLDYVLKKVATTSPKFQEIFKLTKADGIKPDPHIWRDIDLSVVDVPASRVVLVGDAAHAMSPFRGEGGYHSLIDAMELSKKLVEVKDKDIGAIKEAIAAYNAHMIERGSAAVRNSRDIYSAKGGANQQAKPTPEVEIDLDAVTEK